jgi:hypothetical protein
MRFIGAFLLGKLGVCSPVLLQQLARRAAKCLGAKTARPTGKLPQRISRIERKEQGRSARNQPNPAHVG